MNSSSEDESGGPPAQSLQAPAHRRVKLYKLSVDNLWLDQGTGYVFPTVDRSGDANHALAMAGSTPITEGDLMDPEIRLYLTVVSEEPDSSGENHPVLLHHCVQIDQTYQRQQGTLIVWMDAKTSQDLALSFQLREGCDEMFLIIETFRTSHGGVPSSEDMDGSEDEEDDETGSYVSGASRSSVEECSDLPEAISLTNLRILSDTIADRLNAQIRRGSLASMIVKFNYVEELIDLFHNCEELHDEESLRLIASLFKSFVLINETVLDADIFSDKHILDFIGVLEYDPEVPACSRVHHREFLKNNTLFCEVIHFDDPTIVVKIRQTFYLQYIKDTVCARFLDDASNATINSMIFFNELDILTYIQNDDSFQVKIFKELGASEEGSDKRRQILCLLQDILTLSKNITSGNRIELFRNLKAHGLFEYFHITLNDPNIASRLATAEIIGMTLVQDPSLLRTFLSTQRPPSLLTSLLNHFISDEDTGLMILICDILKALCDINTISDPRDKDEFTEFIYRNILPQAINPILSYPSLTGDTTTTTTAAAATTTTTTAAAAATTTESGGKAPLPKAIMLGGRRGGDEDDEDEERNRFMFHSSPRSKADEKQLEMNLVEPKHNQDALVVNICELVCFCLARHGSRIRSLLTTTWLLSRVSKLLCGTHSSHVLLAALRLLRTVVGVRDDQLDMFFVKANLLQPAINLFSKNAIHNNMVNSSVLELVDFVRRKNISVLISYISESFGPQVEELRVFYPTFDKLLERYRQNKEHESSMFSFMP